jgi:hypothetical protein
MSAVLSHINVRFSIQVRGRPVQGLGGAVATHCFLVLLDQNGEVVDSLSFDPSNSVGWQDADPQNDSRGSVEVEARCSLASWEGLAKVFKQGANRKVYVLGNHNCCHAVMEALVGTNLTNANAGIHFARVSNNTWHTINGNLASADYIKKNQ